MLLIIFSTEHCVKLNENFVPRAGFEPARPKRSQAPQACVYSQFHHLGPDYFSNTSFLGLETDLVLDAGLATDFLAGLSLISLSRASLADFSRI